MRAAIRAVFGRLREDDGGQGLVEYGLLAVLIALAVVATLTLVGSQLNAKFTDIKNCLQNGSC